MLNQLICIQSHFIAAASGCLIDGLIGLFERFLGHDKAFTDTDREMMRLGHPELGLPSDRFGQQYSIWTRYCRFRGAALRLHQG